MSTTSLKLPEDLKQKAAAAARDLGITPHAFMVDAIRQAAVAAELRAQFVAEARLARAEMLQTGVGHDAEDVRTYLQQRLLGEKISPPVAKPWRD
jgi:predicted transcriptional regulator